QFATFTENLLIDYRHNQAFSHAWSLCVEEHFYLVLPWLTLVLMQKPAAWKVYTALAFVFVAGVAVRGFVLVHVLRPLGPAADHFGTHYIEALYYPTYVRLDGLLAGVSCALVRTFRPGWWAVLRQHGHSSAAGGAAVLAIAGWCSLTRFTSVTGRAVIADLFGYPLLGLGFALLTASALSENGWLARVRVPGARLFATLAFSLYLTHKAAIHIFLKMFPNAPDQTYSMLPVYLAVCLAVAAVLYFGVERPFLVLRNWQQRDRVAPGSVSSKVRFDPAL
ncbi:MAG: acyltransferase family protein, partial [Janthinobacterium lividum]